MLMKMMQMVLMLKKEVVMRYEMMKMKKEEEEMKEQSSGVQSRWIWDDREGGRVQEESRGGVTCHISRGTRWRSRGHEADGLPISQTFQWARSRT